MYGGNPFLFLWCKSVLKFSEVFDVKILQIYCHKIMKK